MIDELEAVRRLRAEVPPPTPPAWEAVRRAVRRAADLERGRVGHGSSPRWRSSRFLACGLTGLALTGAAAYGATQVIGVGSPAPHAPNQPVLSPARQTLLLGLRVPDPAGGPAWGIRLGFDARIAPTVAVVEVQVGRVQGGQLGFVGKDNAFHNDGLFHSASTAAALMTPAVYKITGDTLTTQVRSIHHFDLALAAVASAYRGCGTIRDRLTGWVTEPSFQSCPRPDLRTVILGNIGPGTKSVSITGPGLNQTQWIHPADHGFYLFVTATPFSQHPQYALTVACQDGRTVHGRAGPSQAGPDAPTCDSR